MNFSVLLIARSLYYVIVCAVIIVAVAASRVGVRTEVNYYDALSHEDLKTYLTSGEFIEILIYSVVLSFLVNFVRQVNRLLGQNVLLNYAAGKYHPPIKEVDSIGSIQLRGKEHELELFSVEEN